jgi:hypothetical protein
LLRNGESSNPSIQSYFAPPKLAAKGSAQGPNMPRESHKIQSDIANLDPDDLLTKFTIPEVKVVQQRLR